MDQNKTVQSTLITSYTASDERIFDSFMESKSLFTNEPGLAGSLRLSLSERTLGIRQATLQRTTPPTVWAGIQFDLNDTIVW